MYAPTSRSIWNCAICCWKPRPSSPIVFARGTTQSSRTNSAVSLLWLPIFSIVRATLNPGASVGTTMSDIPE